MLWTRFYEIPTNIKKYIKYAKLGEYRKDSDSYIEPLFSVELASGNQKIIKVWHMKLLADYQKKVVANEKYKQKIIYPALGLTSESVLFINASRDN